MPLQLSKVETTRLVQYPNPPPKPPLAPHCIVDRRFRKPTDVALERRFSVRRSADELRRRQRDLQEHEAAFAGARPIAGAAAGSVRALHARPVASVHFPDRLRIRAVPTVHRRGGESRLPG